MENVRLWHKADIRRVPVHVRYWGNSGHRDCAAECPVLTQSGLEPGNVTGISGPSIGGILALVALRKPPSSVMESDKSHGWGYSIDPRHGCPRASANGGFCRRTGAGPVFWRRRQSITEQGNTGAVARALVVVATKENAETFADPCAHFQGRSGTRSLEAGHHRAFPDPQDLSDLSVVGRSWAEVS